jgi:hypothetical protein
VILNSPLMGRRGKDWASSSFISKAEKEHAHMKHHSELKKAHTKPLTLKRRSRFLFESNIVVRFWRSPASGAGRLIQGHFQDLELFPKRHQGHCARSDADAQDHHNFLFPGIYQHSAQTRAPHTNGPRDAPQCGALSSLQKPLHHMGIQRNWFEACV